MKKNILILFAAFLMAAGLLACGAENKDIASDNENLQIVATIFPEYDWVKNILGENHLRYVHLRGRRIRRMGGRCAG